MRAMENRCRPEREISRRQLFGVVAIFALLSGAPANAAPFAYVPCEYLTFVIDTASDAVVTTIPVIVGAGGSTVAIAPGAARVYVSSLAFGGTTSIVDTSMQAVVDVIPTAGYVALHPTASLLYAASSWSPDVSVIGTATGVVTDMITGFVNPHPFGIVAHPAGGKLYVANVADIKVIGTGTNSIISTINTGAFPLFVTLNASGSKAYAANYVQASVSVIDTATDLVVGTIATGSGPRVIAVHPDGSKLYVSNTNDDTLSVVDTATNLVVATIPVGDAPNGVDVVPDGSKVYVVNGISNTVSVIDTATNTVVNTIAVGDHCSPEGRFIASSASSTATTAIIATGTLAFNISFLNGNLDFDPGPTSVFGNVIDIDAALSGTPMTVAYGLASGKPGGLDLSFSATTSVLPAFTLSGTGRMELTANLHGLFTIPLAPPTGSVLPNGPIYSLVADVDILGTGSGPFTLSATVGANTPAVPGATVPVTTTVQLCPIGPALEVPLTVQFSDVSVAGTTTVTGTCQTPASIPPNIRLDSGSFTFFFDVTTTASYTPPIRICGSYPDNDNDGLVDGLGVSETSLTLLHDAGGNGNFLPAANLDIDTVNNRICGEVDSLSPFLLAVADGAKGFVPPDAIAGKCEHKLLKQSANLLKGMIKCYRKAAEAAAKAQTFDGAACAAAARAKYDDKVADLTGCPACLLANADDVGDAAQATAASLTSGLYCAGTTIIGGNDLGLVPSDAGAAFCARQQGKGAAKLGKKLGKCYRKHVDAVFKAKSFDLDACLADENAAFDSAAGALPGCPACAITNIAGTRNLIERFSLDILSDGYCGGSTPLP
jgi:YVTN family beta-propeller protein